MAFYDLYDNMEFAEASFPTHHQGAKHAEGMKFFVTCRQGGVARLENVLNNPFRRVPYTEAVDILQKSGQTWSSWSPGSDLQSEHERYLTEKHFKCP